MWLAVIGTCAGGAGKAGQVAAEALAGTAAVPSTMQAATIALPEARHTCAIGVRIAQYEPGRTTWTNGRGGITP